MAKGRNIGMEAIDEKIKKAKEDVIKAKKKYDNATANLKQLLDKKEAIKNEKILAAIAKSNKSYEDIMTFLCE